MRLPERDKHILEHMVSYCDQIEETIETLLRIVTAR